MTETPEMRRPPQLWEQRLAKVTSIVATGMSSSGATSLTPPGVPPATGGNFEPAAVTPPPGAFIKPSTPTLVGGLQGINVLWDGLNSDGDLWPYDTSFVEVHMATSGTGFTPGTATLKGRLARPGNLFVGGLTAGTTYYFRLRGVDAEGSVTEPSDAASGLTGLTTASDYGTATIGSGAVSFNARSIGGVTTSVGSTQPSNALEGDIWLDNSPIVKNVSGITANGTALTVTTSASHALAAQDNVALSGVLNTTTRNITTVSGTGSQVTYTTNVAHGFANGSTVSVSGVSPAGYNLTGTITATTSNTFTISSNATGSYVSGGVATVTNNSFNISGAITQVPSDTTFTLASTLTGTYLSGGTVTGPVKGLRHKRYNGTAWVLQEWGPESFSAKSITALQIAAGAITAGAIAADAITGKTVTGGTVSGAQITGNTITGNTITGGTVSGSFITGGTVEGAAVRTSGGNSRIIVRDNVSVPFGNSDAIDFFGGGSSKAQVTYNNAAGAFIIYSNDIAFIDYNNAGTVRVEVNGNMDVLDNLNVGGDFDVDGAADIAGAFAVETSTAGSASNERGFRINSSGQVFSYGIDDNTTTSAANVRVGASAQLVKSTSTQNVKTELIPLDGTLAGVDPAKISSDDASVNPYDVLEVIPTEFQSLTPIDASARMLGFIAENVAIVFPWAAEWDVTGQPNSVADRPILAALLQVVKDQQETITDLRARIEALEA